ncbi:hypothetical protein F5B17DRAFT_218921 [Nemania serpens]|nr:hypothetical protein F5B17DRAFT_218921 [Nemania serpens]
MQKKAGFVGIPPATRYIWQYEERKIPMEATSMLLIRILIGKVKSMSRLRSIFEHTPVRAEAEGWNCVGWVREALVAALQDGRALATSACDWESVRNTAMWYIEERKAADRFDRVVSYDRTKAATWDMLEGIELVP